MHRLKYKQKDARNHGSWTSPHSLSSYLAIATYVDVFLSQDSRDQTLNTTHTSELTGLTDSITNSATQLRTLEAVVPRVTK